VKDRHPLLRLPRTLAGAILGLALLAPLAHAEGVAIYAGNDCDPTISQTVTNTCSRNDGVALTVFGTVVLPHTTKTAFIGALAFLDLQAGNGSIPDWWRADACRQSAFSLATDPTIAGNNCSQTLWDAKSPAGNNLRCDASGLAGHEQFQLGAVLYPDDAYDLHGDGNTEFALFRVTIMRSRSTNPGGCNGCLQGACIVLNEVQVQGLYDDGLNAFLRITQPIGSHNWIQYNSGGPVCSASAPPSVRTWGSVKALYR
jgi:hypothetical protein